MDQTTTKKKEENNKMFARINFTLEKRWMLWRPTLIPPNHLYVFSMYIIVYKIIFAEKGKKHRVVISF